MNAPLRERFALPRDRDGRPLIYFGGHSLGLAPRTARERVLAELQSWEQLGVRGHHAQDDARGDWIGYAERLVPGLAALVGAQRDEVVAMNSLTVNLHLLMATFYRPAGARRRIVVETGAFSSDRYAVESQIRWHGLDPADALLEVSPATGTDLVDEAQLEELLRREGETVALVLWPGVQFRTGQSFDLARIARAARAAGCHVGFDLAHSVGNTPLALHDWAPDFAVWCGYKYLNGGPGAIGGAFIAARHRDAQLPRLAGWWGQDIATRFAMGPQFTPGPLAAGWQVSNPPILSAAPLLASLEIFAAAGPTHLTDAAPRLTAHAHRAIDDRLRGNVRIITPADPQRRGAQLSLRLRGSPQHGRRIFAMLERAGVVADWREPDILRIAPVALYNTADEVDRCVELLAAALLHAGAV